MLGPRMEQADEALVAAWRAGDRAASKVLFARYYDKVARFFANKVGPHTDDLVQRTFLACFEGFDRYREEASFERYVFAVAYKVLCKHFDALRRSRNHDQLEGTSLAEVGPSPSSMFAQHERSRLMLAALRQLPTELQTILELHYWERLSGPALAEILELPEGTVRTRLRRGKQLLVRQVGRMVLTRGQLDDATENLDEYAAAVKHEVLAQRR